MNWQENLHRYLEIENILNRVFDGMGHCTNQCILKPDPFGHCLHSACCQGQYYKKYDLDHPAYALLVVQRNRLYPTAESLKNIKRISPCEYLSLKGCILATHKSPICIGFLCRNAIDALRNRFGIFTYDYLGINYALEWILTGDLNGRAYADFRTMCLEMAEAVNGKL